MFKPLRDLILIEPITAETTSKSGAVFIPETSNKEKPTKGKIVAVGELVKLTVGTEVVYRKWGGDEIKIDNKTYLVVKEQDLLGVID